MPKAVEVLQATFPQLDSWGERTAQQYDPDPGSDLAADDTDWPLMRTSQVALMGLQSNRDHLQAVRIHVEAGQLFPFAQSTLIRAALVGAAQAVWVLSPRDPDDRRSRSRLIAAHMYGEHAKYLNHLRTLAAGSHPDTETVAATVSQRRDELTELRGTDGQQGALNTTAMVEDAARAAFGTDALTEEVLAIWRLTSGATHGFAWALLGQAGTVQMGPPDAGDVAPFGAGGDLQRILNSYMGAYHLGIAGWRLLDARGGPRDR